MAENTSNPKEKEIVDIELQTLRGMREINIGIKELQAQQSAVNKRYKRGVKMLEKELATLEAFDDDASFTFEGSEPWLTRSPEAASLIAMPILENVPENSLI